MWNFVKKGLKFKTRKDLDISYSDEDNESSAAGLNYYTKTGQTLEFTLDIQRKHQIMPF